VTFFLPMKKLVLLLFIMFPFILFGQTSVVGRIEAEIITPVSAIETEILNFGKVVVEVGGGSVMISPNGVRSYTGNVLLVDDIFGNGRFILSGVPQNLVSIVLPSSPQKLYTVQSGKVMTVDKFASNVPIGGQITREIDGKSEISVGATLYIDGSGSNYGFYSGSYEVVFSYN